MKQGLAVYDKDGLEVPSLCVHPEVRGTGVSSLSARTKNCWGSEIESLCFDICEKRSLSVTSVVSTYDSLWLEKGSRKTRSKIMTYTRKYIMCSSNINLHIFITYRSTSPIFWWVVSLGCFDGEIEIATKTATSSFVTKRFQGKSSLLVSKRQFQVCEI